MIKIFFLKKKGERRHDKRAELQQGILRGGEGRRPGWGGGGGLGGRGAGDDATSSVPLLLNLWLNNELLAEPQQKSSSPFQIFDASPLQILGPFFSSRLR